MLNKRKAQGLSITTIIISVIALIVLVVLIAVFTGRFSIFSKGLGEIGDIAKKCEDQGGTLMNVEECGGGEITSSDSITSSKKCCKSGGTQSESEEETDEEQELPCCNDFIEDRPPCTYDCPPCTYGC